MSKFKSLKQKQGAMVDSYMAELKVLIKESCYEQNMQQILLKDQFIFGVTVREIQEHLLMIMTLTNAFKKKGKLNHILYDANY